jgi:hypothetical protein
LRLPRPCRLSLCGSASTAGQLLIGETPAKHVPHGKFEAPLVPNVFAVVVTERLLIEVAKQMERFDTHVSSVDAALQKAPVVLKPVGVYASIHVLDRMV